MKKLFIALCAIALTTSCYELNAQAGAGCTDLGAFDFGPCDLILGTALINGECAELTGCSTIDVITGVDYSAFIFNDPNLCQGCLPCQDLTGVDFGPCDFPLGYYWDGASCIEVSGCSTVSQDLIDYATSIYPSPQACEASCSGQKCVDLSNVDFGLCAAIIGYTWNGNTCIALSGCGTIGSDGFDYADFLFPSPESCLAECQGGCVDISGVDFGLCLAILGYGMGPNGCQAYSGCSTVGADGFDYVDQFFETESMCENVCSGCINLAQIDSTTICPLVFDPVCGCDGVTYENYCFAENYAGVTSWIQGPCPEPCDDLTGVDFGGCLAILGWGNIGGECVEISGCSTVATDGHDYDAAIEDTYGACAAACGVPCLDLAGLDFGGCAAVLGYGVVNGTCTAISGCGTVASDGYDYSAWIFASEEACLAACIGGCIDLSNVDFGPCLAVLGYIHTASGCQVLSGCSTTGADGFDYSAYIYPDLWQCENVCNGCINLAQIDSTTICPLVFDPVCGCDGVTYENYCFAENYAGVTSWIQGACPGPCEDLTGVDLGNCAAILGWGNMGGECVEISGCSTVGTDGFDYDAAIHDTFGACADSCGVVCLDLDGFDFGPCDAILGYAYINGECTVVSGCSTTATDGFDYAQWFYATEAECVLACGDGCYDPDLYDPNGICPLVYDPVCGCDGVTYDNYCEAELFYGISVYTFGPCPDKCEDLSGFDFGPCAAILGWGNIGGECVEISGCSTTATNGIDYDVAIHDTYGDCAESCDETCLDLANLDFGPCDVILGWAYVNGTCGIISGCSTTATDGYDYGAWFYATEAMCILACGDGCFDPDLYNPSAICPLVYDPVCGCDGVTYENYCFAENYGGVSSYTQGPCPEPCVDPSQINNTVLCIGTYDPVCGCDNVTYQNDCVAYWHGGVTSWTSGPCCDPCIDVNAIDPDAICPDVWDPVCGCDGVTYGNECEALAAGVTSWTSGVCECIDPNQIDPTANCPEIYDPVCGCDGITYGNPCEAEKAGVTSYTLGECPCPDPSLIDPQAICPDIWDPVCGCDGVTYSNSCEAEDFHGVYSWTAGECPCQGEPDPLQACPDVWDPVCGCDGNTYGNSCEADAAGLNSWTPGQCPCIDDDQIDGNVICALVYDPVCGCDGLTYANSCIAEYHYGVTSWTAGECPCPNPDVIDLDQPIPAVYDPVCGCDGITYGNWYEAFYWNGITTWTDGECPCLGTPDPTAICPDIWDPVCGCDGNTYGNSCEAAAAGVNNWTDGECPCIDPDLIDPNAICIEIYDPVCGCDGITYQNFCYAQAAGVTVMTPGACPCIDPDVIDLDQPIPAIYDPVCGCDGVNYDSWYEAFYWNGVTTWTDGPCPCQVDPDPNQICPLIYDPVCGCDGDTYSNACFADKAGITSWTDGPCPSECIDPDIIDPNVICVIDGPVCGCDGITYDDDCIAQYWFGVTDWTDGPCPGDCVDPSQIDPNPICIEIYDPVCGCDGVTYQNDCYAQAAGVQYWTAGECPCVGDPDPNQVCPDVWDPVCGCDGLTYGNDCEADAAGVTSWTDGPCPCPNPDLIDPNATCTLQYDPVCGCDNVTYSNSCFAEAAGVYEYTAGECPCLVDPDPDQLCPLVILPVCGCNGVTYSNACEADKAGVTAWTDGACPCQVPPDPNQVCPDVWDPVCGCNGLTYGNDCEADAAGVTAWIDGPCPCPNPDLVDPNPTCPEIIDPVCGCDNVTYENSCLAEAAGVYTYTDGACPCLVPGDPDQLCPALFDPVCGCNGVTYGNACEADKAGVTSWTDGPCECQVAPDPNQLCPDVWDPVCGCNGLTYGNACEADAAGVTAWTDGACPCPNPDLIDPTAICPDIWDPVCGCDGVTYGNSCDANAAGVYVYASGVCDCIDQSIIDPDGVCTTDYTPVCGCDGVTYPNACHAQTYAGVTSWTDGECACQGDPQDDMVCPAIFAPVCGCDGNTYSNACEAVKAGISSWTEGACPEDSDGDGVPDEEDCAPNDILVYQGAPCDDGNPETFGDTIDDCCNCVGIPSNCGDGDPCTYDFYSDFAGCLSFDVSITSVNVDAVHWCDGALFVATLSVDVNNPDYGGSIILPNGDIIEVDGATTTFEIAILTDGGLNVWDVPLQRVIGDQVTGPSCGPNFPIYDIADQCPIPCPSDINGDGKVDTADLLEFLQSFGTDCPE